MQNVERFLRFIGAVALSLVITLGFAVLLAGESATADTGAEAAGIFGESRLSTPGEWTRFPAGYYNFNIYGAFDGSSVTVERKMLDGSIQPFSVPELVGAVEPTGDHFVALGAMEVRVNVDGGASPSVNWEARRISE